MIRTVIGLLALVTIGASGGWAGGPTPDPASRLHAAVFLVRGSVVGSHVGAFGPFVRTADTAWQQLSRSNLITFGFGAWTNGPARRLYVAAGNGLHRSTDDGASWKIVTGWRTMEITSVLPDPQDGKSLLVTSPWGVYGTTDDGATWQERMKGMRRWYTQSLVEDVRNNRTVYVVAEDGVYLSTDRAKSWTLLHGSTAPVTAFLQLPGHPETFLLGLEDKGIRITTDGGRTWRNATTPFATSIYGFGSSRDGRTVFAGGWGSALWRSTDGGNTWTSAGSIDGVDVVFCFLVDANDADHVFVGTDGNGVYESIDGGMHWTFAGLRGGKIKHLFMYP